MPLPVTKRYSFPPDLHMRFVGSVLAADVWPAVGKAEEVLAVAHQRAVVIQKSAQACAADALAQAQEQAIGMTTQATLVAQREVWQGVLAAWLEFMEHIRNQHVQASDLALEAVKLVVSKLKLNTPTAQKISSSVLLVLEQQIRHTVGELRACVEDAEHIRAALTQWGRTDIAVQQDPTLPKGVCVLRCGDLSFETNFDSSVQAMLEALEQAQATIQLFGKGEVR